MTIFEFSKEATGDPHRRPFKGLDGEDYYQVRYRNWGDEFSYQLSRTHEPSGGDVWVSDKGIRLATKEQFLVLPEDAVNKADKLNKLIDEIPVCKDGKAKIRALVQELSGVELNKPVMPPRKFGQVWLAGGNHPRVLGYSIDGTACAFGLDGVWKAGSKHIPEESSWEAIIKRYEYTFAADNIQQYFNQQGGKVA